MAIRLSIISPEREILDTEADSVVSPAAEGEFGALQLHEPFLAALQPGVVRYQGSEGEGRLAVSSGFAEVTAEHVTLLVRTAEFSQEIDRPRAEAARAGAEEALRLAGHDASPEQVAELRDDLARAEARIAAAG